MHRRERERERERSNQAVTWKTAYNTKNKSHLRTYNISCFATGDNIDFEPDELILKEKSLK
jgi:hypothetical protein